jgi:undecaprenyl diphosphate synthase
MGENPKFDTLSRVPEHLAIIMDGNKRWAEQRQLSGVAGHKAGIEPLKITVEHAAKSGVKVLSLFAFSSENWQRPKDEVLGLMDLFTWALTKEVDKLVKNNLRLRIIGDRAGFSASLQKKMQQAELMTADNTGMLVVVAANYGGQWDIAQAAQSLAKEVATGHLKPEDVTAERLGRLVGLADLPAPDLCIRTGGEIRLSNFLLWQMAYTELYFTPILWPDFNAESLYKAFVDFALRERRFGCRASRAEPQAAVLHPWR